MRIEPVDLARVVEEVAANLFRIGPVCGHSHIAGSFAGANAGALLVHAMRLRRPEPEKKRRAGWPIPQELLEVRRVIARIDRFVEGGLHEPGVVLASDRVAREPARLPLTRPPALPGPAGKITRVLQQV